jgi:hypothetical protein
MGPDTTTGQPPHHTRSSILTKHAQAAMFSGRMPRFASTHLASFAPCVRRNLPRSQVGRLMFSRAYIYHALQGADTCATDLQDAEQAGDQELAQFFREVQGTYRQLGDRSKTLLRQRLR